MTIDQLAPAISSLAAVLVALWHERGRQERNHQTLLEKFAESTASLRADLNEIRGELREQVINHAARIGSLESESAHGKGEIDRLRDGLGHARERLAVLEAERKPERGSNGH